MIETVLKTKVTKRTKRFTITPAQHARLIAEFASHLGSPSEQELEDANFPEFGPERLHLFMLDNGMLEVSWDVYDEEVHE